MSMKRVRVTISTQFTTELGTPATMSDAEAARIAEDVVRETIKLDPNLHWDVSLQMEGES